MKIPGNIVRLATQFMADKKDVREYLRGISISPDGIVSGANGHVAFVSNQLDVSLPEGVCIVPTGTIKKGTKEIEIDFDNLIIKLFNAKGLLSGVVPFELSEYKDMGYANIVATHKPSVNAHATLDTSYMGLMAAFEGELVSFYLGMDMTPSLICSKHGVMIVMPCTSTPVDLPAHFKGHYIDDHFENVEEPCEEHPE